MNLILLFLGVLVFPVGQSVFKPEERAQSLTVHQLDSFIEGEGPENDLPEGKEVYEKVSLKEKRYMKMEGKEVHENGRKRGT